jgi:hypothetical protein
MVNHAANVTRARQWNWAPVTTCLSSMLRATTVFKKFATLLKLLR